MSYAGFWKRVLALIIDMIIMMVVGFVVGLVSGFTMAAAGATDPGTVGTISNVFGIVVGWLYFALMESSSSQATVGKMALGIKVTDLQGNRISFARATGRHFAKIISSLILLIGYIMAAFTEKKQGLHDMIASCLVVNK